MPRGRVIKPGLTQVPCPQEPQPLPNENTPPPARRRCRYGEPNWGRDHVHYQYEGYDFAVNKYETIVERYEGVLYKWIGQDGRSSYGGNLQWDLPKDGQPGDWAEPDSKYLSTCDHGLHALRPGDQGFGGAGRLFIAESDGPVMIASGKVVCMRLRLVKELDLQNAITPEIQAAAWRDQANGLIKPRNSWQTRVPVWVRQLIDPTSQEKTRANMRAAAKGLLRRYDTLGRKLAKMDAIAKTQDFSSLREKPQTRAPKEYWQAFHEEYTPLYNEHKNLRRKLRSLETVAAQTNYKVSIHDLRQYVDLVSDPDLKKYLQPS